MWAFCQKKERRKNGLSDLIFFFFSIKTTIRVREFVLHMQYGKLIKKKPLHCSKPPNLGNIWVGEERSKPTSKIKKKRQAAEGEHLQLPNFHGAGISPPPHPSLKGGGPAIISPLSHMLYHLTPQQLMRSEWGEAKKPD